MTSTKAVLLSAKGAPTDAPKAIRMQGHPLAARISKRRIDEMKCALLKKKIKNGVV